MPDGFIRNDGHLNLYNGVADPEDPYKNLIALYKHGSFIEQQENNIFKDQLIGQISAGDLAKIDQYYKDLLIREMLTNGSGRDDSTPLAYRIYPKIGEFLHEKLPDLVEDFLVGFIDSM